MNPHRAVALGFLGLIVLGAILLVLPISNASNTWMSPFDALFTSVSASCITGLTVIDPGSALSRFGQGVLLFLVQVGCMGIMTLGTFFLVLTGRRLSFAGEFSLSNAYGMTGIRGWKGLVVWVVLSMFAFEALGTIILWWDATRALGDDWQARLHDGKAWYEAYFYAVMSFCHAGFSLSKDSLAHFRMQPVTLVMMGCEVIVGGLGFLVLYNLFTFKFWRRNLVRRGRISLQTRVTLLATCVFLLVGIVLFGVLELRNVASFVSGFWNQASIVFFQAVTPRTCGFTVLPVENMQPATIFLSEVLMFIGAAPGSAGGGVKVTTCVVFLLTLVALYRGRREVNGFHWSISEETVRSALVIVFFYGTCMIIGVLILLVSESDHISVGNIIFEVVSALTTTGLSCGDTTRLLSPFGRVIIMALMFLGRIGALGMVLLLAGRKDEVLVRYPRQELIVG